MNRYMISLTLQKTRELYGDFQLHQMPVLLQFDPITEIVKNATWISLWPTLTCKEH